MLYFIIQVSKALAGADKKDLMRKLPRFIYDEDKALEVSDKLYYSYYLLLICFLYLLLCLCIPTIMMLFALAILNDVSLSSYTLAIPLFPLSKDKNPMM